MLKIHVMIEAKTVIVSSHVHCIFLLEEVAFTTRSFDASWRNRVDFITVDFIWMLKGVFHLDRILADSVFTNNIL